VTSLLALGRMLCNCIELLFQVDVTVGNVPGEETCKKKGKGIR